MRPLEFKAYVSAGHWIAQENHIKSGYYIVDNWQNTTYPEAVGFAPETEDAEKIFICQYSGIKDRNGKKIFEGDIVAWIDSDDKKRQNVVKWLHGGLCLCNAQYTVGSYIHCEIKVIGNKFENPELFKKEK
jgi:hypothetical protein